MAIFTRPKTDWTIEGTILDREAAPRLWQELATICDRVGVAPPDQVIAGIDDNFFVTEHPVTVNGTNIQGKTLFVSLPLLKQLNSTEADTILAHEMGPNRVGGGLKLTATKKRGRNAARRQPGCLVVRR